MLVLTNKKKIGDEIMKLSNSQEEYLKTIYLLECGNNKIRVTDIAKRLDITKPSVSKALNIIKDLELIEYETYGEIKLTAKAKKIAKDILKKQDLIEMFLIGILGVEEESAKQEAVLIKSTISKETEEKLYTYIRDLFEFKNTACRCDFSHDIERCKECSTTKIRNKLNNNKEWVKSLKDGRK